MKLLDTNVFLRFIVPDDRERAKNCSGLLDSIGSGKESGAVTPMTMAELCWVLSGYYRFGQSHVMDVLRKILNTPHLTVLEGEILARGLEIYEMHSVDFIDAYHIALMEDRKIETIYSYDTDFDRVRGITRKEP